MGEKSLAFVEKAYAFAQENENFRPPYLNMTQFDVDYTDAHSLWTLLNKVRQLQEAIDDIELLAGSEAFQAALVFYHAAKDAAERDIAGAKAVYEELKTRFPGGRHKRGESETETKTVTETFKKQVEVS